MLIWLQPLTNSACVFCIFRKLHRNVGVYFFSLSFLRFWNVFFQKWCQKPVHVSPACDVTMKVECSYGMNCGQLNLKTWPERYIVSCALILLMQLVIIWLFFRDATKYNDRKLGRTVPSSIEQYLNVTLVSDVWLLRDSRSCLLWEMEIHLCYFSPGLCFQMKKRSLSWGNCPVCADVVYCTRTMRTSWYLCLGLKINKLKKNIPIVHYGNFYKIVDWS